MGATNWPRAIHEGNWSRILAPGLNILVSVVFLGLWGTGLFIWMRRKVRMLKHATERRLSAAE